MAELRKDPSSGRWVIVSTERVRRPADFSRLQPRRRGAPCAFCPGHERETPPEIFAHRTPPDAPANAPGWRVRVVPDRFPALRIEGHLDRRGDGMYDLLNGIGAHEIIVESPDHDGALGALPLAAVEEVVRTYRERIVDLKRDDRLRSALIFKHHGLAGGSSHEHPHSQLIATPVVPSPIADEMDNARVYHTYHERCLFCDMLHQELAMGTRVVIEGTHVVAFAPFAARSPFETWLMPRRHGAAFEHADPAELRDLARTLRIVLRKLDRALGTPPYRFLLHSAPFDTGDTPVFHWHVEVAPALLGVAPLEWSSGLHVNLMPPEDAARFLRDAAD